MKIIPLYLQSKYVPWKSALNIGKHGDGEGENDARKNGGWYSGRERRDDRKIVSV